MPIQPTYPGVYIEEVPSGVTTITGVATSIALFMGRTERGPMNKPTLVFSYSEFVDIFGDSTETGEMAASLRLFFLNGGTTAYLMRIATGAFRAGLVLKDAYGNDTLQITAKEYGTNGNTLRAEVDYNTTTPDKFFNLRLFRFNAATGIESDVESYKDLTMNPNHPRHAVTVVNNDSSLAELTALFGDDSVVNGKSVSAKVAAGDDLLATFEPLLDPGIEVYEFHITVGGSSGTVTYNKLNDTTFADLELAIQAALVGGELVAVETEIVSGADKRVLRIRSKTDTNDITIRPGPNPATDLTTFWGLGLAEGGIEKDPYHEVRPAPSGVFVDAFNETTTTLGNLTKMLQQAAVDITLTSPNPDPPPVQLPPIEVVTTAADDRYWGPNANRSLKTARDNLLLVVNGFNAYAATAVNFDWRLELTGSYLGLRPLSGDSNEGAGWELDTSGAGTTLKEVLVTLANPRHYTFGAGGIGDYQLSGPIGSDGATPDPDAYLAAHEIADNEIDVFNLLIYPRDAGQSDQDRIDLLADANAFCKAQRAFQIIDPPSAWNALDKVLDPADGISKIRTAITNRDHAAIYWPRLTIAGEDGDTVSVDPSGAIAGLMSRIDANRGVWKAPAGLEANIGGIRGVTRKVSDSENGFTNPQAVNTIRAFPSGIVSWGARTVQGFDNSGNDDYKYVPVRRLALFIEESLYRGLQFAVFEGNDEGLWSRIRVAAGAFMNNLFRQGAFQGEKASDAYFVKVDSETTTQNDINLGVVNVLIGFAPLKPAEFVIVKIQQIAGQVQT